MSCRARTALHRHRRRPAHCSPRPLPYRAGRCAGPVSGPVSGPVRGLVNAIAAIIPAPGAALCVDDESWTAFENLLTEAADRVAGTLGPEGAEELRALRDSGQVADPVRQLLIQRTLERLTADERSR